MGDLIGRSFIYHGFKILQPLGNEFYTTKAKNGVLMTADDSTIQISDIIINTWTHNENQHGPFEPGVSLIVTFL